MASMAASVGEAAVCGSRRGSSGRRGRGGGLTGEKKGSGEGKGEFREEPSASPLPPLRSLSPLPRPVRAAGAVP